MGIRVSPKHGVNPSMGVCFYCGEDDGTIVLAGRMKGDAEAPRKAVWTKEPCSKCKELMAKGIMLIQVDETKTTDRENPWRTGRLVVITEEAARRTFKEPALGDVLRRRAGFMPIEGWKKMGLPEKEEA